MERKPTSKLEDTVKSLLRQRSLSMRQLAASTGINVATISTMISGKQRGNPEYLKRMAYQLSVRALALQLTRDRLERLGSEG